MNEIRIKYQVEESASSFSFKPFYYYRKKMKWYILSIILCLISSWYFYTTENEKFYIISITLCLFFVVFLIKEWLFNIPIKYTFDTSTNSVYKKDLFYSHRQIMRFDEVIIFQSKERDTFQYKMGKKRSQFVKNFQISEDFSSQKVETKLLDYEQEILDKISQIVSTPGSDSSTSVNKSHIMP